MLNAIPGIRVPYESASQDARFEARALFLVLLLFHDPNKMDGISAARLCSAYGGSDNTRGAAFAGVSIAACGHGHEWHTRDLQRF